MRIPQHLMALTAAVLLAACNKSPSAPTSQTQGTGAPGPTLRSVRVSGPDRVAPGETVTYVASASYSDGSSKDVSASAVWSPTSPSLPIYFNRPGVAVGARPGEIDVFAHFGGMQGSTHVLVLEKGTFKLAGAVTETSGLPLAGVSIEVLSGTGAGLRATANPEGLYVLYGVAGPIELRASGDGFIPQVRDLVISSDSEAEKFALAPKDTPADVSGAWTMTLALSPSCPAGAPAAIARGRTYDVVVSQRGTGLTYTISGPTVTVYNPQTNSGIMFGSHLKLFFIGDTDYGDWSSGNIIDQVSPTETLEFDGIAEGNLNGSEIRATMSGDIVYWDKTKPSFDPNWYCRAKDHIVTLAKTGR